MTTALIVGTGGSPGQGVVRSLKMAPEPIRVVGTEVDKYAYFRSTADKTYLTPRAGSPESMDVLCKILRREEVSFIHAQPEKEVFNLSQNRQVLDELRVKYLLPSHEAVIKCQDKFASYSIWKESGLTVPSTILVESEKDLKRAFRELGPKIWLRQRTGGGGEGALPTDNYEFARIWLDRCNGWGNFTAAELLSEKSVTWASIWNRGDLVVAQSRRRLYWEYGAKMPSGVSGVTGVGVTIDDPELNDIAQKAILAIAPCPHGIFGVDLTEGLDGRLYLTEINIGRFFTTIHFFTEAGLNMPYILMKSALGESVVISKRINPLAANLYWIRGMDFKPRLVAKADMERLDALKEAWKL